MASTVLPNGIIIPEKYSRDWYNDLYHNWQELDNLLGGGTPKDGTLTIQKNGTTVETFTANSSTDKTVDITVPTKTSELTNDSGYITADDTKIPLAGSNQISGDLIPSTDGTVNLGSPSYQWNQAYIKSLTINGVSCGDILTYNVSEFVNVTGNQTVGGTKTFSALRTYFGRDISLYSVRKYGKNLNPASNTYQYLNFSGNLASEGSTDAWTSGYLEQVVDTNGGSRGRWFVQDTSENAMGIELLASGNDKQLRPYQNNTTDLGTANRKWKSFNGINPGALSLPNKSSYINIDTTNWDLTCSNQGVMVEYVAEKSGWLELQIAHGSADIVDFWVITGSIRINNKSTFNTLDNRNFNMISLPVVEGDTLRIYGNASQYVAGRRIDHARIYTGLGQA